MPTIPAGALEAAYNSISRRVASGKDAAEEVITQIQDGPRTPHRDPETYHAAKKEIKHAILEFHRYLEYLKNFQVNAVKRLCVHF